MNRNILPGVAGVAIVLITAACSSGVSTTPSGHTSSTAKASTSAKPSAPAKAATVGDYFDVKDSSGNTYRVTLDKLIDPAQGANQFTTPSNGKRFVGAVFTVTAVSGSPKNQNANNNASVVGANGQTYTPDFSPIAGYTDFKPRGDHRGARPVCDRRRDLPGAGGVTVTRVLWGAVGGFGGHRAMVGAVNEHTKKGAHGDSTTAKAAGSHKEPAAFCRSVASG